MNAWLMGGPAIALVAAAAVMWTVRRRGELVALDEAAACRAVAAAVPGFTPQGAVIGQGGLAAIVSGGGARVAVLQVRRPGPVAYEVRWNAVRASAAGLLVDTGRPRPRQVLVSGIDALDVRRIMPMPRPG